MGGRGSLDFTTSAGSGGASMQALQCDIEAVECRASMLIFWFSLQPQIM